MKYIDVPESLREPFDHLLHGMLSLETTIFTSPPIDWDTAVLSAKELVDLRRFLRAQQHFLGNSERVLSMLVRDLSDLYWHLADAATDVVNIDADEGDTLFEVPLIEVVADPNTLLDRMLGVLERDDALEAGLFTTVHRRLYENVCAASGVLPDADQRKPFLLARNSSLPSKELAETYLAGTPLLEAVRIPVPLTIPTSVRFEHTHILAGSGHGKTQTLQHLIMADARKDWPACSLVVIDSQGEMIEKLSRLSGMEDRLLIIDPRDTPALNLFDVHVDRFARYGEMYREQILNGVIELYDYLFGSLLGSELTAKQSVIFRYLARLMLTIPGATIHTLIELLSNESPYRSYIARLPVGARLFFETEFPHKSFADTKRQIQRRLWGILENPTFEKMMTAPRNRVDMFEALQGGKIVLVNTAKDFLKAERSSFLGRFFIALTLQATLERAAMPADERRPAFLYIDEAADYFDDNIDDLLTQARKYRLGVVFAHQYLDQLAPALRSSIASNTSIKFAGGVSDRDARSLAPDMRTTPTFIMEQRKESGATHFACFIRNVTGQALSVTVPFGSLERAPKTTEREYRALRERNRKAVCAEPEGRSDGPEDEPDLPDDEEGLGEMPPMGAGFFRDDSVPKEPQETTRQAKATEPPPQREKPAGERSGGPPGGRSKPASKKDAARPGASLVDPDEVDTSPGEW